VITKANGFKIIGPTLTRTKIRTSSASISYHYHDRHQNTEVSGELQTQLH